MKRITKITLPESENTYDVILYEGTRFLTNDSNNLFFEADIEDNTKAVVSKHRLYIIKYNGDDYTYIPEDSLYLCTFTDNAHIRYFVYEDVSENPLVKFGKLFKWDK